jgi:hypothetical protein
MTGEKYLRNTLKTNLMDPATGEINFSCCGIHVSASELQSVYWALNAYQLNIEIHRSQRSGYAFYSYQTDTFKFQSSDFGSTDRKEKALMVHECVHAMLDLLRLRFFRTSAGETVGYVTQALFIKYAGAEIPDDDYPILVAAREVAKTIWDRPGATADATALENVIRNHPDYKKEIAAMNNMRSYDGLNILNAKGRGP